MIRRGTHLRPSSQGPGQVSGVAGGTSNLSPAAAQKRLLRRDTRAARDAIPPQAARRAALHAARHLLGKLRGLPRLQRIAVYLATGSELDCAPLIAALHGAGRKVFVPVIPAASGSRMHMVALHPGAPLRRRLHGIREPHQRPRGARVHIDLVVLPLRAFDRHGTRLGSGAGYYDRWLARQRPRPLCVGYAYALQQIEALPREAWDQPLDAVCTELGPRCFSRR